MDSGRRRALTDFYREEFLRHLHQLELNGCLEAHGTDEVGRACQRVLGDIDRLCCCAQFPALAETLLQRFDVLTGLSQIEARRGH